MSRSGYGDEMDSSWELIKWRGQVASAIRGRRGQAFLRELVEALEEMPEKRLITDELRRNDGEVCALGCVGQRRDMALEDMDPEDYVDLAAKFGIAHQLVREIEWVNDNNYYNITPEKRWKGVRDWATENIRQGAPTAS